MKHVTFRLCCLVASCTAATVTLTGENAAPSEPWDSVRLFTKRGTALTAFHTENETGQYRLTGVPDAFSGAIMGQA